MMRTTSTGAVLTPLATPYTAVRNLNVIPTTASSQPVASNSRTSHSRPTLVKQPGTKKTDYLIVGVLLVALFALSRKG